MKLGIQKKLILSYSGIGAAVALLSATAVVSLREKVTRFGDFHSPALFAIQDLENRANVAVREGFAYLGSGDALDREDFERRMAQFDERLAAFRALISLDQVASPEEKRLFEAIVTDRRAFLDLSQLLFREPPGRRSPRKESFARLEALAEALARDLHVFVEFEKAEVDEAHAAATGALRLSMALMWAVGFAALAVSAVVGRIVGKRIVEPVRALQAAATNLGDGSREIAVACEGHDELADVARAFNEMARRVHAVREELESQVSQRTAQIQQYAKQLEASLEALRAAQTSLVASERLAAVGMLAAGVAHEINNPLAYILGNLAFVRDALSRAGLDQGGAAVDRAEVLEAIDEACHGAEKVRDIVRDLKMFSATGGNDVTGPVDVNQVVELALNMASNHIRHRAELVKEFSPACLARANEGRLTQVLLNLVINAVQALPETGLDRNRIRVVTHRNARTVEIEVSDNGCGIRPEHMDRIWEPFFTTKPVGVGTGLGLPICRRIVEALGGSIVVESQLGTGSRVRVALPSAESPAPPREARGAAQAAELSARIHLVDAAAIQVASEGSAPCREGTRLPAVAR